MDILLLLIPASLFLLAVAGLLFWWSVRSGQYDDLAMTASTSRHEANALPMQWQSAAGPCMYSRTP